MALPLAHVGSGTYEPLQLAPLLIAALAYARRSQTLSRRGAPVPVWRQACFAGGIAVAVLALVSPVSHIGEELLLGHMAQHLLLGDIAALLVVLGLTGPLLQPLLAIRRLGWIRRLAHPLVALPIWVATLYVWHIPALYDAALTSEPVHALEHASFFGAGLLMWMGLLGPLPQPAWFGTGAKVVYVVAVRLAGAALGNVLMWSGTVLYPYYEASRGGWDIAPLSDQGAAGVVMMVESTFVTLAVLSWLFLRWAREDTERQRLLDLAEERGVPLDAARAGRAVAAGEGARLERRLLGGGGDGARRGAGAGATGEP